jgi:hypothetical protein
MPTARGAAVRWARVQEASGRAPRGQAGIITPAGSLWKSGSIARPAPIIPSLLAAVLLERAASFLLAGNRNPNTL